MSALTNFQQVPVVDVSGLFGGPEQQRAVADELSEAARQVGFLYVVGSGVDRTLFEDLVRAAKQFFALPHEEKSRVYIGNSSNHRGYVPAGEEVFSGGTADLKEAYDLGQDLPPDDPDYVAGNPLLGPNQWPELPGFAAVVGAYYDAVLAFGKTLMGGFALALDEPADRFEECLTKPPSQLRLIHYPVDTSAVDVQGIGAHTDYECFTLLRPTSPGLEVLNGAGEWIDVPPMTDAFVVNIGDLLEILSNGEFVATTHRVRKVTEERYSFPLFFNVDYPTVVRPLEKYLRADGDNRESIVAGEHLFAQTAQSFGYLKRRRAAGQVTLPEGALGLSSFGRQVTSAP